MVLLDSFAELEKDTLWDIKASSDQRLSDDLAVPDKKSTLEII